MYVLQQIHYQISSIRYSSFVLQCFHTSYFFIIIIFAGRGTPASLIPKLSAGNSPRMKQKMNRYCNSNPKTICPILNKICFLEYYQLLFLTRKFLHGQWKLTQTALIKNKLRCNEHLKKTKPTMQSTKGTHREEKLKANQQQQKKGMHFSFPITEFISAIQKSCDILTTVVAIKIISSVKTAC